MLLFFIYLGKTDVGLTVDIVFGVAIIAAKIRWKLRKHVWFWAVIAFILLLHIPLFFIVRWPQGNIPTLVYTMPLGIVDFLLISGGYQSRRESILKRFFVRR